MQTSSGVACLASCHWRACALPAVKHTGSDFRFASKWCHGRDLRPPPLSSRTRLRSTRSRPRDDALYLRHLSCLASVIEPLVTRLLSVRHPHEWQQRYTAYCKTWSYAPLPSTVRIVTFGFALGANVQPNCPLSGGQRVLERCALGFELLHELCRQCSSDEATLESGPSTSGTLPCASRLHVANNSSCLSVPSRISFKSSYNRPTLQTIREVHCANSRERLPIQDHWSREHTRRPHGATLCGRSLCNSGKVSSVPGATE